MGDSHIKEEEEGEEAEKEKEEMEKERGGIKINYFRNVTKLPRNYPIKN